MVIELTDISPKKNVKETLKTQMKKVNTNGIRVNLKNVGLNVYNYISICLKVSFIALRNHVSLLCGLDSANKRLVQSEV